MNSNAEFNLSLAIEAYLEDIANHQPLDREEWEELFDHLFTETEAYKERKALVVHT
jgi:anthranilate phosphoribosyltransferase